VAALVPKAEVEKSMGESVVGQQARLMSQALRKLTAVIGKTKCIAIFINQLREKIGVMYGNPEVTTGGRALKFYSSVRIDVRKVEPIKQGSEIIGARTRAKVVKNKMAPPFREATFDIIYGKGISKTSEILDAAVKLDVVKKSGAWYYYNEARLGQGRDAVRAIIENQPELMAEIEAKVRANSEALNSIKPEGMKKSSVILDDDEPLEFMLGGEEKKAAPAIPASGIDIDADDDF